MKAGDWLRAAERDLPTGTDPAALLGPDGAALVLAPHPDDESLGCGGLIAACAAAGRRVTVVVVSDGAGSHPGSEAWPPPRLAALRQAETRAAVTELGLDAGRDLHFLGLPDRAVPWQGPAFDAALARLAQLAPARCTILAAWQHDPHADHATSFVLAQALQRRLAPGARLLAYPVWGLAHAHPVPGFPLPPPPGMPAPPRGYRLDVRPWLPAKRRAIAAHRSQLGQVVRDDPVGFVLPQALLDLACRPQELFLEEAV
ncbi:PIG-L deacetylase family protein [Falsiroseomonas tokyonensis]|uniref:PIG-L deacetylase family protein n=1 Tax=Falsiroseomonas tokyonensis TaxID=430521 RepID=A0ABV7BV14_9PROT|nr:PIG-L deacetylase family protein [Falsiroseomonas tokyonensis]MBU8537832.1 PIG-L family deacetylase [Falsiroseomonas tokyonensis]